MSLILLEAGGGGVPVGTLDTDVLVQRLPGRAKSLVRVPIAVDPATPADQAFNIDGHACQVYHLNDHVRFATALVPGDGVSWPRTPTSLRVAQGAGVAPAEAGTYPTIDLSGMKLVLNLDGVQFSATLADAIHEDIVAPIGAGHREQVGPDLLRRKHYLLRLKREGVVGAGVETTDYCTVADVSVTTRVDMDLAVIEILWMAGAWNGSNNPFVENPTCSGPIYFDALHIPRATLPAGYGAELFGPHPFSFVTNDNVLGVANMPAGQVHWMSPTGQYSFRFAIWNPATVDQPTARKVLRYHDRGRAWCGPLSYQWNHAYGERLDAMIDRERWQTGQQGEEQPWRDPLFPQDSAALAMDRLATQAANNHRLHWEAGTAWDPTFTRARNGWLHGHQDPSVGGPAGGAIQGLSDNHQGRGWFEVTTIRVDAMVTRIPLSMIDIADGYALSDRAMAEGNSNSWVALDGSTPGQVGRLPYQMTTGLTYGTWVHPHFVSSDANLEDYRAWRYPGSGGGLTEQLTLAPAGRLWNSPPAGKTCPYLTLINWQTNQNWGPYDMAHASRALSPMRDSIWLLDDPIGHRVLEQYAQTRAMIAYSRKRISGYTPARNPGTFAISSGNAAEILATITSPPNQGYWTAVGNTIEANTRNIAWSMQIAAMYWHVAPPAMRAQIHGAGSDSWFRALWQLCELTVMENGLGWRTSEPFANPNPYNTVVFGSANLAQREGSLPRPSTGPSSRGTSFAIGFQLAFLSSALFCVKHGPLRDDVILRDRLDGTIRLARAWYEQARTSNPSSVVKRPTYFVPLSFGPAGILDPPLTLQDIANGAARWVMRFVQQSGQPVYVTENYTSCSATLGYRETGDMSYFDIVAGDFGVPAANELALFFAMRDEHNSMYTTQIVREQGSNDNENTTWIDIALAELIFRRNAVYRQL